MKSGIHPQYHHDVTVTCSCGHSFQTGSTKDAIHVDICSACHPFFTGEMKYVDVQGRVEKFQAKQAKAKALQSQAKVKKLQKKQSAQAKSLKDMLTDLKAQQAQMKPSTPKKS